jgi:hypothetical protein
MKHLEDKEIIWFLLGINIPDKKKRHLMNCNYCKNRAKKLEKSLGLFSNFYPTISESKLHYIGSNIINRIQLLDERKSENLWLSFWDLFRKRRLLYGAVFSLFIIFLYFGWLFRANLSNSSFDKKENFYSSNSFGSHIVKDTSLLQSKGFKKRYVCSERKKKFRITEKLIILCLSSSPIISVSNEGGKYHIYIYKDGKIRISSSKVKYVVYTPMLRIVPFGTVFEIELLGKMNKVFVRKSKVRVFVDSKKFDVRNGEMFVVMEKKPNMLYYRLMKVLFKEKEEKILEGVCFQSDKLKKEKFIRNEIKDIKREFLREK